MILVPIRKTSNAQRERGTGEKLCSNGNTYNPHPTNCRKYYYCSHKKVHSEYTCGPGFLWNDFFCDSEVNYVSKIVNGYGWLGLKLRSCFWNSYNKPERNSTWPAKLSKYFLVITSVYVYQALKIFVVTPSTKEIQFNKHFEGSCELLRFDAFALPELLLYYFTVQVYTKPV